MDAKGVSTNVTRRAVCIILSVVMCVTVFSFVSKPAAAQGTTIYLGTLGAATAQAYDINSRGQIVGHSQRGSDNTWCGFVLNPADINQDGLLEYNRDANRDGANDLMQEIGGPGTATSIVRAINNNGWIVGVCALPGEPLKPYIVIPEDTNSDGVADNWYKDDDSNGINDLLSILPSVNPPYYDDPSDINDDGVIVGTTFWTPTPGTVFPYTTVDLLYWGQGGGVGWINDNGVVVGSATSADGATYYNLCMIEPLDSNMDGIPDTWVKDDNNDGMNDLMQAIGPSDSRQKHIAGVNNQLQVAGSTVFQNYPSPPGWIWKSWVWDSGVTTYFMNFTESISRGINNLGDIVGDCTNGSFLYSGGAVIYPGFQGSLMAINDNRQAVGFDYTATTGPNAVLWTPILSPSIEEGNKVLNLIDEYVSTGELTPKVANPIRTKVSSALRILEDWETKNAGQIVIEAKRKSGGLDRAVSLLNSAKSKILYDVNRKLMSVDVGANLTSGIDGMFFKFPTKTLGLDVTTPAYSWLRGCGPTAGGMVIGFWDSYFEASSQGDCPLIAGSAKGGLPTYPEPYENSPTVDYTIGTLADLMLTTETGSTNIVDIGPGLYAYAQPIMQSNTVTYSTPGAPGEGSLTWDVVKTALANGPMILFVDVTLDGQPDHFVTVTGWCELEDGSQILSFYNTWDFNMHYAYFRGCAKNVYFGMTAGVTFDIL